MSLPDDPIDVTSYLPKMAAAFRRGSLMVGDTLAARESMNADANEEYLTNLLLDTCAPDVQWVDFNRPQEAAIGADWLWWFVEPDGTSFGLLTQAKKLRGSHGRWTIDLAYPKGSSEQLRNLMAAADRLGVPAAHILYFGRRERRPDVTCDGCAEECWRCAQMSAGVLATLAARQLISANALDPRNLPVDLYRYALPLEMLAITDRERLLDLNLGSTLSDELRSFLVAHQEGVRGVARRIFRVVSEMRSGQFAAASPRLVDHTRSGAEMFDAYPEDTGHFGVPYFEHVLRGLRWSPPSYVSEVIDENAPAPPELDAIRGIVRVPLATT